MRRSVDEDGIGVVIQTTSHQLCPKFHWAITVSCLAPGLSRMLAPDLSYS